jgi:hypothetical protein
MHVPFIYKIYMCICLCALMCMQADKVAIKVLVDELLALKNKLAELTGGAPAPATAAAPAGKKEAKAASTVASVTAPTAAVAKKDSKPAASTSAPTGPPATVKSSPPPQHHHPSIAVDIHTSVWKNGSELDVLLLDTKLKTFSYVGGFTPTQEDNRYSTVQYKNVK